MSDLPFLSDDSKEKLKKEYDKLAPSYEKLVDEVLYILKQSLSHSGIKLHGLSTRKTKIKTFKSFLQKVERKRIDREQFEKIEDIAGIRVICLYRSDLKKLGKLIFDNFGVVSSDISRTRTLAPFGYSSDHYTVRISKSCTGPRYDDIRNLKCEIQVRTIVMDAWASVSHHLEYKKETDIPRELKTDFNALAGLFYVADTHFEMFRDGVSEARKSLTKSVIRGAFELDQEINFESLCVYMQWKFPERKVERHSLTAYGWSRIISELGDFGYTQIRQLDDKVNIALPILKEFEQREFHQKMWRKVWAPDGLIRVILDLTDSRYVKRHGADLKKAPTYETAKGMWAITLALLKEYRSKLSQKQ